MDWRFKDGSIPRRTVPILKRNVSSSSSSNSSLKLSLFHPDFLPGARMFCEDEEAELAYWKLSEAAMRRATPISMRPGDVLVVDNARSVHGRRKFQDSSHHSITASLAGKAKSNDSKEPYTQHRRRDSPSPSSPARWLQRVYVSSDADEMRARMLPGNILPVQYFSHEPMLLRRSDNPSTVS
mmetsp:Transcript_14400/g.20010  ORF Transcript_14400/g.20010 Transcript_14400/m.20010 type:complete len:182 (+) Transcript_14400:79-624(+)